MRKENYKIDEFGEVFTSKREVNDMVDMINNETNRLESTFLEPACGDGNFLSEVLNRKLKLIESYKSSLKIDFQANIFKAASSLYGIDIQKENVEKCRIRLFEKIIKFFEKEYTKNTKFEEVIKLVLEKNILLGDALTLRNPEDNTPIVFSQWSFLSEYQVKRLDYSFKSILNTSEIHSLPLFSDFGEQVFIPEPISQLDIVHFLKIKEYEK